MREHKMPSDVGAPRALAISVPLKVTITNWEAGWCCAEGSTVLSALRVMYLCEAE
jgi:hypothetical protein